MTQKGRFERRGDFLWPKGITTIKVRVALNGAEAEVRPIEYISSEEIGTTMLHVLTHSIGISQGSLIQETANFFRARLTPKTKQMLETELSMLLSSNKITRAGEILSIT